MQKQQRVSRYIPKKVKDAVRLRDKNLCRICGGTSEYMEFDHITPYSKGAPATVENIQLACRKCNLKKRDKTPKCDNCGSWIPYNSSYCQKCGKQQKNEKLQSGIDLIGFVKKVIGILLLLFIIYLLYLK